MKQALVTCRLEGHSHRGKPHTSVVLTRAQIAWMVTGANMALALEVFKMADRMPRMPYVPATHYLLE